METPAFLYDHLEAIQLTCLKHDPTRRMRTPMGEYIVPPDGKPLTSLGNCNPAPSDYSPKVDLTKPAPSQFSIAGRRKAPKPNYNASPADCLTSKDLVWSDRSITLKDKGKTRPYDIRDDHHLSDSVGPLKYNIEHEGLGKRGPKWTMANKHLDGVNAGPPNGLVQPEDTHGFDTPGPNYRPNSAYWGRGNEKSFGLQRRNIGGHGPGPAEYTINEMIGEGPAYTLAKRLPPPQQCKNSVNKDSPGPGSYDIGTTIGKAMAKSMSSRQDPKTLDFVPAPNIYNLPDTISSKQTAGPVTMTYRPFEYTERPHPAPNNYTITEVDLKKAPTYSISKHTKPTFPDVLSYPLIAQKQHAHPGPGSYELNRQFNVNDKPKYSMGKRARTARHTVPGPNHYNLAVAHRPDATKAPAFSMGSRLPVIDKRVSPGPAAYYPLKTKDSTGYSMTSRPMSKKKHATPAPNNYNLHQGQTKKGVYTGPKIVFKSRGSPYVHSGLKC